MKKMQSWMLAAILTICGNNITAQAQNKICMSFDDFKANNWKSIESITKDSCRLKYDGMEFTIKTDDKEANRVIKKEAFMMSLDRQLFINTRTLRDGDGNVLPVSNYARAIPFKGGKLCVVCYHVTLSDLLDMVNIGLDIGLLATGHTTWGTIFLATDLLLANDNLMQNHVLYLIDNGPNEKGKINMTRMNDQFMEKLLRDDPVTYQQYYGRSKKGERQSAANILPILVKKGYISDYHHK